MSQWAYILLKIIKIIKIKIFKPHLFYEGDFGTKLGIFGTENPLFGVNSSKIAIISKVDGLNIRN